MDFCPQKSCGRDMNPWKARRRTFIHRKSLERLLSIGPRSSIHRRAIVRFLFTEDPELIYRLCRRTSVLKTHGRSFNHRRLIEGFLSTVDFQKVHRTPVKAFPSIGNLQKVFQTHRRYFIHRTPVKVFNQLKTSRRSSIHRRFIEGFLCHRRTSVHRRPVVGLISIVELYKDFYPQEVFRTTLIHGIPIEGLQKLQ